MSSEQKNKFKLKKAPFKLSSGLKINVVKTLSVSPNFTVLCPPLIGGSYLQQLYYFEELIQNGCEIISFNYRGHKGSEGLFSIKSAVDDTLEISRYFAKEAKEKKLGFFAIGTCFASMPVIHAQAKDPGLFDAIGLVSGMYSLQQACPLFEALKIYYCEDECHPFKNPFDLLQILFEVNQLLFPDIEKTKHSFGLLQYKNARALNCFLEYLFYNPLKNASEIKTPSLCIYAKNDRLLKLYDSKAEKAYQHRFKSILPLMGFNSYQTDHYWTSAYHYANEPLLKFFNGVTSKK